MINRKICLLGMFATGKTSLVRRYVQNLFDEKYLSTIGVNITQKLLPPIQDEKNNWIQYNFVIWDIEGADPKSKLVKNYYLGAHGAILVTDLTRMETLDELDPLINVFQSVNPDANLVIAGSKHDLCDGQSLPLHKVTEFGAERNINTYFTSSKTGENVEELFHELATLMVRQP